MEVPTGRRWTYAQLRAAADDVALGLLAAGVGNGGPGRHLGAEPVAEWTLVQFATAKIGAILVNINPAYRTHELGYVLKQAGISLLVAAPAFKTADYAAMIDAGPRRTARTCARWCCSAGRNGTACWPPAGAGDPAGARPRGQARTERRRPDQHPVHLRHHRDSPRARRCRTTTSSTTATSSAGCAATPRDDRVCIPVPFYHCFGMVMGNLGAVTNGATMVIPAPGIRAGRRPCTRSPPSGAPRCTGCRPCSSPSSTTPTSRPTTCRSLRTGIMAGSPCPVEVMKQVVDRMGMTEVTICYGMTETSPVSTQTRADDSLDRRVSTVGRVHPHVEVKIVDPDSRLHPAPRRAGRTVHPRVLGDARLLGRAGEDRRGDRRRPLDAHRRPRP